MRDAELRERTMSKTKPPPIDAKRLIWSSDWFVNDVELPMELPAPVSNNELSRRAAKLIQRKVRGDLDAYSGAAAVQAAVKLTARSKKRASSWV